MYKLYFPKELHDAGNRGGIFPLLKPFLKRKEYTDEERRRDYNISERDYSITENIFEADILILSMSWNHYLASNQKREAENFVKSNSDKKVFSFVTGDYGVDTPDFKNLIVLRQNGDRSKFSKNHIGMPVFIDDPLIKYFNTNQVFELSNTQKPVVGFCGQANYSKINAIKEIVRVLVRNFKYSLGLSINQSQPTISTSYLRGSILQLIKKSVDIKDNFIERKKYRAGVKTENDRKKTTQEFYENIKDSQYIICVRGGGNFSVRIYETLAMGRIPVFVNTDCLLPLDIDEQWKEHILWVERKSLDTLTSALKDFHSNFDEQSLNKYLKSNRKFWETHLTLKGYFEYLFSKTLS